MSNPTAPFYADKTNLLTYIGGAGQAHRVQTAADWARRRAHILANMQLVMGPMPGEDRRALLEPETLEEVVLEGGLVRRKIAFSPEPGDRVPAYLFIPASARERVPAVLCLHQTTTIGKAEPAGLGGSDNLQYALELARRGFVTLAPDYPGYGDYAVDAYALGYASATMKGIWNHRRALDLLQSLPEADPDRLGCIGHSLGGHNTLFLAAFDERVKVAVASCGFCSFARYMGGDLRGWSHRGYMPRIQAVYGANPAKMPFDFPEILGAIAPRAVFTNSPLHDDNFEVAGVYDCLQAAGSVYELLGAAQMLQATHPDCGHDFPPQTREAAYSFIETVLDRLQSR